MDRTQHRNKRTIPIRFNEGQSYKYKSNTDMTHKLQFTVKNSEGLQKDDNYQSSQQYIQSSYLQPGQQEVDASIGHNEGGYLEENYEGGFMDKKELNFRNQMKTSNNPYELTFKKQMPSANQEQSYHPDQGPSYSVAQDVSKRDFEDSSQSFQQLPYAQYNNKANPQRDLIQASNPQSLFETHQKLFHKYGSALVNYHYFHSRKSKNIEQKHKQHLLSLLVIQLQKNIFVTGLKLNFILQRNKRKQFKSKEQRKFSQHKQTIKSNQKSNQQGGKKYLDDSFLDQLQPKLVIFQQITYGVFRRRLFECFSFLISASKSSVQKRVSSKDSNKFRRNYRQQQQSHPDGCRQDNLNSHQVIPFQNRQKKPQKAEYPYNEYQVTQSQQSQPMNNSYQQKASKQQSSGQYHSQYSENDQENSHYQEKSSQNQSQQVSQQQEELEELDKIRELIQYIEQLKKEARDTDSQIKRYFIKWKIYMLEEILEEYQRQQQYEPQDGQQEEQEVHEQQDLQEHYDMNTQRQQGQLQNIYHSPDYLKNHSDPLTSKQQSSHRFNRHTKKSMSNHPSYHNDSNLSDIHQENIKQKKIILKSFLYEEYLQQFWDCFTDNYTNRKLMIVSQRLREQSLKKNVLQGFRLNVQWRQRQRVMEEYYEQLAEDQDESQYRSAQLFYRTNLKTKYFFELVKSCRNLKWVRKLDKLTLKFAFGKMFTFNQSKNRKQQNIERYFTVQRTRRLFKSFQAWKESTVLSSNYQTLRAYCEKRDAKILAQYFSLLQILYKQTLIKQRKALNYHKSRQMQGIFEYLKFLSVQSRDLYHKQRQLRQYLTFTRGNTFYQSFYEFYGQRILQHRLNIRAQKLAYNRQKQLVYERLEQWRNHLIKRQSYEAIEYRLIKLRQKQTKERIFNIWLDELDKRLNKRDELEQSAQHKDWLVKYYGSLCDIATSGKQFTKK